MSAGVAVATVDSVGRRPLLLWGVSGMTLALLGLGASSLALSGSVATWASVAALLLYVGAYQVGKLHHHSCLRMPIFDCTAKGVSWASPWLHLHCACLRLHFNH